APPSRAPTRARDRRDRRGRRAPSSDSGAATASTRARRSLRRAPARRRRDLQCWKRRWKRRERRRARHRRQRPGQGRRARSNYNERMPVVRYVALAALVVWLGSTVAVAGEVGRHLSELSLISGAVMVVGLFVMKFVGPPPHAFVVRVALVAAMLAVTLLARWRGESRASLLVAAGLGFVLLA